MAITQIRLDTQTQDATLTPAKISTTATDDFSFPRDVTATRNVKVGNGTSALPSLAFTSDATSGLFSQAVGALGLSAGGAEYLRITSARVQAFTHIRTSSGGSASSPDIEVGSATTGIFSSGSSDLHFTVGSSEKLSHNGVQWETFSPFRFTNGSAGVASIGFTGDPTTGIFHPSAGIVALTISSTETWRTDSTGLKVIDGTSSSPSLSFTSDTNTGLFHQAAGAFGLATSGVERVRITTTGVAMQGTSTLDMGSNAITSVADPTNPQDAATKSYVDNTGVVNSGVAGNFAFYPSTGSAVDDTTALTTDGTNVTVTNQLNLNTGNKITFDNGGAVYLQSNAGDNMLIGHSSTTSVEVFALGAFGQIDIVSQAQGSGYPKLSLSPAGTRGSVLWTTSGAGSVGSRYIGVQFDDDITNAFHSIERFARTSIASPYLEFGYDADGSSVTGSHIKGSTLTVESTAALALVGTSVTVSSSLLNANGSAVLPSYTFASDNITGMYHIASDTIGFATGGLLAVSINPSSQLDLNSHKIVNVADPTLAQDAATKNYIDTNFLLSALTSAHIFVGNGSNVAADVAMSGDVHIDNTGATTIQPGAVTSSKIASATITNTNVASGTFAAITGIGAQSQDLDMNTHKVSNVVDPLTAQDAATKNYVDLNFINKNGSLAMAANLDLGSHRIINVSDPTGDQDAATKAYVDTVAAGLDPKASSRVATASTLTLTTDYTRAGTGGTHTLTHTSNGVLNIDGVNSGWVDITNDGGSRDPMAAIPASRVLVKNASDPKDNGIYAVQDKGSLYAVFTGQVAGMTTNVTITADNAGTVGNITLVADGVKNINTLISDWNTANPSNTVTLSSGDGTQIPTANIVLAGGTDAAWVLIRATDSDGTPSNEVSGGNFTFIEGGTTNASTGWTISAVGNLVVDTDNINWIQFSAAGAVIAGTGLSQTGATINFNATDASLTVNSDDVAVHRDAAGAIGLSASGIAVNVDGSTLEINTNAVRVKDAGITYAKTNIVTRETPTGTVDGVNAVFTLANSCAAGSEHVFLNGILQDSGAGNDYTISGSTITFAVAPVTGSKVRVSYWKA